MELINVLFDAGVLPVKFEGPEPNAAGFPHPGGVAKDNGFRPFVMDIGTQEPEIRPPR